ncbi:MAG TPA: hypothetical protein VGJ72_20545 [Polaromonas sp.]|jgi:hypothetical protein
MFKTDRKPHYRRAAAVALLGGLGLAAAAATPPNLQSPEPVGVPPAIQQTARDIAAELAAHCPLAAAGDTEAYNTCRKRLFGPSTLRSHLQGFLIWGRQSKAANATLRQTNLTQFAPDIWTSMYAPLFMFNGRHTVDWVPEEKMFRIQLEAAFRNRLAPGQFPYPFWHDEGKWAMYENANAFMLWINPETGKIRAAQFTDRASTPMLLPVQPIQHAKYEGPWLWTDEKGNTQPAVTLFDGIYRPENPYIKAIDRQYRDLALQMRESQCTNCHVPNNPDKMSRLVLLSTPAHAAGEIDRLIKAVKEDRMPLDEFRLNYALSPENKKWLLESATAFKATVEAAQAWEKQVCDKSTTSLATEWRADANSASALRPEEFSSTKRLQVMK